VLPTIEWRMMLYGDIVGPTKKKTNSRVWLGGGFFGRAKKTPFIGWLGTWYPFFEKVRWTKCVWCHATFTFVSGSPGKRSIIRIHLSVSLLKTKCGAWRMSFQMRNTYTVCTACSTWKRWGQGVAIQRERNPVRTYGWGRVRKPKGHLTYAEGQVIEIRDLYHLTCFNLPGAEK